MPKAFLVMDQAILMHGKEAISEIRQVRLLVFSIGTKGYIGKE